MSFSEQFYRKIAAKKVAPQLPKKVAISENDGVEAMRKLKELEELQLEENFEPELEYEENYGDIHQTRAHRESKSRSRKAQAKRLEARKRAQSASTDQIVGNRSPKKGRTDKITTEPQPTTTDIVVQGVGKGKKRKKHTSAYNLGRRAV